MSTETSAPDASPNPALETAVRARERVRRIRRDLDRIRREGAALETRTAWRARAADTYRAGLASWRDGLDEGAALLDSFDDELASVAAILESQDEMILRARA